METYFFSGDPFVFSRLWRAAGPAVFVGLYFLIGLVAYGVRVQHLRPLSRCRD